MLVTMNLLAQATHIKLMTSSILRLTWGCSSPLSLDLVFLDILFEELCLLLVDMFSKDYVVCKDNMVSKDCLAWFVYYLEFVLQVFESLCLFPECRVCLGDLRGFQYQ